MTAEGEIPRYPPFTAGMPAVEPDGILETQTALIRQVCQEVKLDRERVDQLVMPAIHSYAAFVHLLPASEAHHHRGAGGLFRHGLEVAFWTVRIFRGYVVETDEPPGRRKELEQRWRYAAFLIGLLHDVGKAVTDVRIVDESGDRTWRPHREPLTTWLTEQGIERYYLRWIPDRHRSHEYVGASVLHHLLPQSGADFLHEAGPPLEGVLYRYLTRSASTRKERPLLEAVERAEAISVRRDLEGQQVTLGDSRAAVPVARYLVDAMRRLVNEGIWQPNEEDSGDPPRLWVLDESSLGVAWPEGIRQVARLLQADEVQGVPSDPLTIAEILRDHGLAGSGSETDDEDRPEQLVETIAPVPLQAEGEAQRRVRVLRVNRLAVGGLDEYPAVALEPLRDTSKADAEAADDLGEPGETDKQGGAATAEADAEGAAEPTAATAETDRAETAAAGAEAEPAEAPAPAAPSSQAAAGPATRPAASSSMATSDTEATQAPSCPTATGAHAEKEPPVPEAARPLAEAVRSAGWQEGVHWALPVQQLPGANEPQARPIKVVAPYTDYLEANPERPMTVLHKADDGRAYVRLNGLMSRRLSDWLAKGGGEEPGPAAAPQSPTSPTSASSADAQEGSEPAAAERSPGSEQQEQQEQRDERLQDFLAWLAAAADAADGEGDAVAVWHQGRLWVHGREALRRYCRSRRIAQTSMRGVVLAAGALQQVTAEQVPEAVSEALGIRAALIEEVVIPVMATHVTHEAEERG